MSFILKRYEPVNAMVALAPQPSETSSTPILLKRQAAHLLGAVT